MGMTTRTRLESATFFEVNLNSVLQTLLRLLCALHSFWEAAFAG